MSSKQKDNTAKNRKGTTGKHALIKKKVKEKPQLHKMMQAYRTF